MALLHDHTIKFFMFLFSDLPDGKFVGVLGTFPDDKKKYKLQHESNVHKALKVFSDMVNEGFDDIFVGIAPRDNTSGKKSSVTQTRVLWADVDLDHSLGESERQTVLSRLRKCVIPPSLIVDSGYGYHLYWQLTEPLSGTAEIEQALKEVVGLVGIADAKVFTPEHSMRVPGTMNLKNPDDPRECRVVYENDVSVPFALVKGLSRLDDKTVTRIATGDSRGFKSRSERDMSVVRAMVSAGLPDKFIAFVFNTYPVGDRHRERGGDYLERTVAKVRETAGEETATQDQPAAERKPTPARRGGKPVIPSGFIVKDGETFAGNERSNRQVATFSFRPRQILVTDGESYVMGDVVCRDRTARNITIPKSAFSRSSKLMDEFGDPNWVWVGSDVDARRWLAWLMGNATDNGIAQTTGTHVTGRYGDIFLTTKYAITKSGHIPMHKSPLIWIDPGRDVADLVCDEIDDTTLANLVEHVMSTVGKLNNPGVIWPAIGWTMAAPVKPILEGLGSRFPILNVWGTRGSGKTTLIQQVLQALSGLESPISHDWDTTNFVLLSLMGSTNANPLSFCEFRFSSSRASANLVRKLRQAYDVGRDSRGRADQTTTSYPLSAPIVIDGEDPILDQAMLERVISIGMTPEDVLEGTAANAAFQQFAQIDVRPFGPRYIRYTLTADVPEMYETISAMVHRAFPLPMAPRVRRNITVAALGLHMLFEFTTEHGTTLDMDEQFLREALSLPLQNVLGDGMSGRTQLLVDEFIEEVVDMVMLGQASKAFAFRYDAMEHVLWIHLRSAAAHWREQRRRRDMPMLTTAALARQVKERTFREGQPSGDRYMLEGYPKGYGGSTVWMHGIDLAACREAGLDVPYEISVDENGVVLTLISPLEETVGDNESDNDDVPGEEET